MNKKIIISSTVILSAAGTQAGADLQLAFVQVEEKRAALVAAPVSREQLATALEGYSYTPITQAISERLEFDEAPPTPDTLGFIESLKENLGEGVNVRMVDIENMKLATQDWLPAR